MVRARKTRLLTVLMLACAVGAQAQLPDKTMKKVLKELNHRDADRRIEAATLLGRAKVEAAVPDLIVALEDPVWGVRSAAAGALWGIGSPAADPAKAALEKRLNEDESGKVRVKAAGALWRLGVSTKELKPHVRKVLDDESLYAQVDAADMLLDMKVAPKEVLPTLERAMQSKESALRQKVVDRIELSEEVEPLLIAAMQDSEWSIRLAAIGKFWSGGSPQAMAALKSATKDSNKSVRTAAQDVLDAQGQ